MTLEKGTTGLFYVSLGAFAAYLGFWWSESVSRIHAFPMFLALGMAAIGLVMVFRRRGSKNHRESEPEREAEWETRAEAAPSVPRPPDRRGEEERNGDAALLGHEMKNYLCTLKGNASLLRQRIKGNDKAIIDRIDRVVEKLESFTRTMATVPNATSTRMFWRLRLAEAAKGCVSIHFHEDAFRFHWDFQDESAALLGDPARLEQVFLNLYANALEAGAEHVTTSAHRIGDRIELSLEDDGRGCEPQDVARIFEPFFTTKQGPARRGLGMFIVQSIVENHGGHIHVRSKNASGKGCHGLVFTLDFPLPAPDSLENPEPAFSPDPTPPLSNRWLLTLPEPF